MQFERIKVKADRIKDVKFALLLPDKIYDEFELAILNNEEFVTIKKSVIDKIESALNNRNNANTE